MRRRDGGNVELCMSQIIFGGQYQKRLFPLSLFATARCRPLCSFMQDIYLLSSGLQDLFPTSCMQTTPRARNTSWSFFPEARPWRDCAPEGQGPCGCGLWRGAEGKCRQPTVRDMDEGWGADDEAGGRVRFDCGRYKLTGVSAEVGPPGLLR